ncbi:unnamed protein product [Rangifer tarandus platyrhynchus]|uniref:Uncharacterized protein n=2 Tax=Rangifer tarandus platyrhynchus TaxID=3082113 RepID=A0ABN8ZWK3_RANTA|nr:unnamed protein product [Rangifer tarandus platyrhynchus]
MLRETNIKAHGNLGFTVLFTDLRARVFIDHHRLFPHQLLTHISPSHLISEAKREMKIEATGLSFLGISAASLCITSHVTFSKCFPNSQSAASQLLNSWVWSLFS